jgi:hypothetical protein
MLSARRASTLPSGRRAGHAIAIGTRVAPLYGNELPHHAMLSPHHAVVGEEDEERVAQAMPRPLEIEDRRDGFVDGAERPVLAHTRGLDRARADGR